MQQNSHIKKGISTGKGLAFILLRCQVRYTCINNGIKSEVQGKTKVLMGLFVVHFAPVPTQCLVDYHW